MRVCISVRVDGSHTSLTHLAYTPLLHTSLHSLAPSLLTPPDGDRKRHVIKESGRQGKHTAARLGHGCVRADGHVWMVSFLASPLVLHPSMSLDAVLGVCF